jgi:hypothetical protein
MARVFAVMVQILLRTGAIAVQTVSETEICNDAEFKLCADALIRVQRALRICLGCKIKSKNRDKQLTHIVRVSFSLFVRFSTTF